MDASNACMHSYLMSRGSQILPKLNGSSMPSMINLASIYGAGKITPRALVFIHSSFLFLFLASSRNGECCSGSSLLPADGGAYRGDANGGQRRIARIDAHPPWLRPPAPVRPSDRVRVSVSWTACSAAATARRAGEKKMRQLATAKCALASCQRARCCMRGNRIGDSYCNQIMYLN